MNTNIPHRRRPHDLRSPRNLPLLHPRTLRRGHLRPRHSAAHATAHQRAHPPTSTLDPTLANGRHRHPKGPSPQHLAALLAAHPPRSASGLLQSRKFKHPRKSNQQPRLRHALQILGSRQILKTPLNARLRPAEPEHLPRHLRPITHILHHPQRTPRRRRLIRRADIRVRRPPSNRNLGRSNNARQPSSRLTRMPGAAGRDRVPVRGHRQGGRDPPWEPRLARPGRERAVVGEEDEEVWGSGFGR